MGFDDPDDLVAPLFCRRPFPNYPLLMSTGQFELSSGMTVVVHTYSEADGIGMTLELATHWAERVPDEVVAANGRSF